MAVKKMININPSLEPLPIKTSCQYNINKLFCLDTHAVAVNYYVLRPQKKNNS